MVKQKITAAPRSFVLVSTSNVSELSGLYHRANALGAQNPLHFMSVFDDRHSLQIWTEDPPRGFLRPGTIVTEGGRFSAVRALCHNKFLSLSGAILPQTVSFYKMSG
jgi:hypothetical protein